MAEKAKSFEDAKYIAIPFVGIRLIFRNGKYDGWYHPKLKKVLD